MRTIRVYVETSDMTTEFEIDFKVDNKLSDEQIGKMAKEVFESNVHWSWDEVDGEA